MFVPFASIHNLNSAAVSSSVEAEYSLEQEVERLLCVLYHSETFINELNAAYSLYAADTDEFTPPTMKTPLDVAASIPAQELKHSFGLLTVAAIVEQKPAATQIRVQIPYFRKILPNLRHSDYQQRCPTPIMTPQLPMAYSLYNIRLIGLLESL
jgi:hypothetical protein